MVDLYINGKITDVSISDKIALTIQVFDVTHLDSILTSFTKTIRLPKTSRNIEVLEYSNLIHAFNTITNNKTDCKLVIDGVEVIMTGYCYIDSVDNFFNINIYFHAFKFFNDIEEKTLNDLNLTDLDHYWNFENIFGLSSPPLSSDVKYPLVEWGGQILDFESHNDGAPFEERLIYDVNVEAMLPVIRAERILNQIVADVNYTIGNNFDDFIGFDKMYLAMADLLADSDTNTDVEECRAVVTDSNVDYAIAFLFNQYVLLGTVGYYFAAIHFNNIESNFFHQVENMPIEDGMPVSWTRVRVTTSGKMKFRAHVEFDTPYDGNRFRALLKIVILNSEKYYDDSHYPSSMLTLGESQQIHYVDGAWDGGINYCDVETEGDHFAPGDFVCVLIEQYIPELHQSGADIINNVSYFEVVPGTADIETIGYGYKWSVAKNLPPITQIDFIKAICQIHGAVITKDLAQDIIYIRRFDEIFDKLHLARDWTGRMLSSHTSPIKTILTPQSLARTNWFRYAEGSFDDSAVDFNSSFQIINSALPKEADIVASIIKSVGSVGRGMLRIQVPYVVLINLGYQISSGNYPILLYVDERVLTRPTIIKLIKFSLYSKIEDQVHEIFEGGIYTKAWFVDEDESYDFHWDRRLAEYYPDYILMMQKFRLITGVIKISLVELQTFDFSIPVFIGELHSYFYVNSIRDYIDGYAYIDLVKLY